MPVLAYIDPGTTGLLAQFAAAGFAGVFLYFRSRFKKNEDPQRRASVEEEPADERS